VKESFHTSFRHLASDTREITLLSLGVGCRQGTILLLLQRLVWFSGSLHLRRNMFTRLYDIAGYECGYEFNIGPFAKSQIFRIRKMKISKIMQKDKYETIITIWGQKYIKVR
jgi:hypothetical protein